jgi:HD-GYP domain-containing protein (c-di-GMP phosphodiesterase class II)
MNSSHISLRHAACGLSAALDLVSPELVRHHIQTATVCSFLGKALGLTESERGQLEVAAALHDIGAIALNREAELFTEENAAAHHAEVGALLLQTFEPFTVASEVVRFHHTPWTELAPVIDARTRLMAQILHLADRAAIRIRPGEFILSQAERIVQELTPGRGLHYSLEVFDAFAVEARRDVFWLETVTATYPRVGEVASLGPTAKADDPALRQLSELFRMVIDFRSKHTATHSRSVAAVAERIARMIGFSARACAMIHVAGNLHDLGKLAVPAAILDKPGKLTSEELAIVRSHPFYTGKVLERIQGFDDIAQWAALHHEAHDGSGYPWRASAEQIPLGARIVALADIFSALAEPRSYRPGLPRDEILRLMREMAAARKLDPFLLSVFEQNLEELDACRLEAIAVSEREFKVLRAAAAQIGSHTPVPRRDRPLLHPDPLPQ